MSNMAVTIKKKSSKKFIVEMDVNRLERLAATFGLYRPEFLASIARAERDLKAGKIHKASSLRAFRK